jgi:hypothetical protein
VSTEHDGVSKREQLLDEVLGAYLEALAAGRAPERRELLARYPDLAEELDEFFHDHDQVNRWTEPLRKVAQVALTEAIAGDITLLRADHTTLLKPGVLGYRLGDSCTSLGGSFEPGQPCPQS